MRAPQLDLEGTSPEMLRRQLKWSEQGLNAADIELQSARKVVAASETRVRHWTTSIDQIRTELRKLGESV